MFLQLAPHFDNIRVKSIVTPFSMTEEKDTINNLMTATSGKAIVSRGNAIKRLGWTDDIKKELMEIEKDEIAGYSEPTY